MSQTVLTERRYTRDDYKALPEGPPYYELIDGEFVEMTKPRRRHYRLIAILLEFWNPYARVQQAELALEPNLYLPGVDNVYHPDLVYVRRDRIGIVGENEINGTPDVICEVLSPTTERIDRGMKLRDYRLSGVPHVWLFTPDRPVMVEEYELAPDGLYRLHHTGLAPEEWEPVAFPGWRIPLAELDTAVAPPSNDSGE